MLRLARLACLLGAFALAGPAFSQNITNATPTAAAVGSTLTIQGTGFGAGKPKVQLLDGATGKKYALKVVDFTDTQIHATITKAVQGNLTLQVIVKGAASPANSPTLISIERPLVTSLSTTQAGPDGEFAIFGDFFGIKKGKVKVGTQSAKVLSWTMTEIHLKMPKKLYDGFFTITVDNKLGIDDGASIKMVGSPVKIGKATLNLFIDGKPLKLKLTPSLNTGAGQFALLGFSATNPSKNIEILVPFNINTDTAPKTVTTGITLSMVYLETGKISGFQIPPSASWLANGAGPVGSPKVQISAATGGQVAGTIDSVLELEFNSFSTAKPATIHLTGDFIADL